MKYLIAGLVILSSPIIISAEEIPGTVVAEDQEQQVEHPPVHSPEHPLEHLPEQQTEQYTEQYTEPQKVYVESSDGSHRRTRSEEHCYFNEEHDHLHCYDAEIRSSAPQYNVVKGHRHYRTRTRHSYNHHDHYNPVSTGVAIGIGLGLPVLLHNSFRHGHHYSHRGYRGYRSKHRRHRRRH